MPEFTLLAFSSAVEALRMANAAIGYDVYTWKVVAPQGDEVQSSCGVQIHCDSSVSALRRSVNASIRGSTVIVCGGLNNQTHSDRATESGLRECKQSGCMIGSLCTGAYVLGQAKPLGERKCIIHWENAASFGEQFHDASVRAALFEIDNGIATCAGGMAAFDMMLYQQAATNAPLMGDLITGAPHHRGTAAHRHAPLSHRPFLKKEIP